MKLATKILVILAVLIAGVYYLWAKTSYLNPIKPRVFELCCAPDVAGDWKLFENESLGISFKYPSAWDLHSDFENQSTDQFVSNSDKYRELETPQLFLYVADFYNEPQFKTDCSQIELGEVCQKDVIDQMNSIEKGTIPNIIKFSGGKGVLTVTCSGNEGWEGIPGPFYAFEFFKDNKKFGISLNDHSVRLKKGGLCREGSYIKKIESSNVSSDPNYEVYNNFKKLIEKTLTVEP